VHESLDFGNKFKYHGRMNNNYNVNYEDSDVNSETFDHEYHLWNTNSEKTLSNIVNAHTFYFLTLIPFIKENIFKK
jgi:hypothetical protein